MCILKIIETKYFTLIIRQILSIYYFKWLQNRKYCIHGTHSYWSNVACVSLSIFIRFNLFLFLAKIMMFLNYNKLSKHFNRWHWQYSFFFFVSDFHYLGGQHPGPFGPFSLLPPQWLDPTYVSYAWPEYFRRPVDLCKLPPPPLCHLPKGKKKEEICQCDGVCVCVCVCVCVLCKK